jgi:hypothetical protein
MLFKYNVYFIEQTKTFAMNDKKYLLDNRAFLFVNKEMKRV